MEKEININEFKMNLTKAMEAKREEVYSVINKRKKALIENTDATKTEELLISYEISKNAIDRVDRIDTDIYVKTAELFNKMARELSREFNATVVDTENHTIRFTWFGNSLSFPIMLLAGKYNLHEGGFGFESSFSRHEAYTENGYKIYIGVAERDSSDILIDFGKIGF